MNEIDMRFVAVWTGILIFCILFWAAVIYGLFCLVT